MPLHVRPLEYLLLRCFAEIHLTTAPLFTFFFQILKIYSRGHQRGAPGVSGGLNELLNVDPRVFS